MNRTEKKQLVETLNIAIQNALANVHTATIARVERVNATTIDVQPVINRVVDGRVIALPVFTKVPPVFMQGGSSYTAHPIAVGDYCLLVFTERCFDRWYEGQDGQPPLEFRMHDYSDGLAIVGVNPRGGAIPIPDVITHIGDAYQEGNYVHEGNREQTGDYTQQGNYTQTGNYIITGNVTINGSLTVNASPGNTVTVNGVVMNIVDGDIVADGISLKNHVHGGVQSGSSNTGAPQ